MGGRFGARRDQVYRRPPDVLLGLIIANEPTHARLHRL
jgi:hypothetical protein